MKTIRFLFLAPWSRAPFRLWRTPALFVSVAIAAVVLGVAAGSRPLFVSSSASAALRQDLNPGCAFDVGLRVSRSARVEGVPLGDQGRYPQATLRLGPSRRALADATAGVAGLGKPIETLLSDEADNAQVVGLLGSSHATVQLLARTDAARHIDVIHMVSAPGIWLPDTVARTLRATAGDRIGVRFGSRVVPVEVHGVFRDLRYVSRGPYWCSMEGLFKETFPYTPPPVALLDESALLATLRRAGAPLVGVVFEYPPDPQSWVLSTAKRSVAALTAISAETNNDQTALGKVLGPGGSSVDTEGSVDHAKEAAATVSASTGPVALGSAAAALLMLVIAVRTWLDHRRQELVVLSLRGAGSVALGIKGALEFSVPLVAGTVAGLTAAYVLARDLGPSTLVERTAISASVLFAIASVGVTLIAVAGIVALRVRRISVDTDGVRNRRLLPWELVALALAAAAFYELRTRGSSRVGETRVDSLVLLFPVLLMAGGAGLLSRAVLSPRVLRRGGSRLPNTAWLALRRLAAERLRAAAVVLGTAVSVGLVVFGASVSSSLRATVKAKSTLGPGAAQVFTVDHAVQLPASSPLHDITTSVTRTSEDVLVQGHEPADVLGVDPATFARAAFWDRSFASQSLPSLLGRLDERPSAGAVPALAVGTGLPDRMSLHFNAGATRSAVPVRVVARPRAFPGYQLNTDRPLIIVNRAVLTAHGITDSSELWVNSTDTAVRAQLSKLAVPVLSGIMAADRLKQTTLEPQLWALRFLQIVGFTGGLVTVSGLGLYFGAKSDRRRLGTALAERLGLTRTTAIITTALEVTAMSVTGLLFGIVLSRLALQLVLRYLDPLPTAPPGVLLRFELTNVAASGAGIGLIILLTVALVERPTSRSALPELLRRVT